MKGSWISFLFFVLCCIFFEHFCLITTAVVIQESQQQQQQQGRIIARASTAPNSPNNGETYYDTFFRSLLVRPNTLDAKYSIIDLAGAGINDEKLGKLANFLSRNPYVRTIYLESNEFSADGLARFFNDLPADNQVETLYLSMNSLKADGGVVVADWLRSGRARKLATLGLSECSLGPVGVEEIIYAILESTRVSTTTAAISSSTEHNEEDPVDDETSRTTTKHQHGHSSSLLPLLTNLDLAANRVGARRLPSDKPQKRQRRAIMRTKQNTHSNTITNSIRSNTTEHNTYKDELSTTTINLEGQHAEYNYNEFHHPATPLYADYLTFDSGNNLDSLGAMPAVAALVRANIPTLVHLDLGFNRIGDQGILLLAEALRRNNVLRWLDLRANEITDAGVELLIDAISSDRRKKNQINNDDEAMMGSNSVISYSNLRYVGLGGNPVSEMALERIAAVVEKNAREAKQRSNGEHSAQTRVQRASVG
eukprot:GEZU01015349.1.p1 GENE.GEZU01015349.1~~GEZU01015349.1.p1  ORF type:complete len:481 (+),score=80.32 GEZU01015349.1:13-1455(+)